MKTSDVYDSIEYKLAILVSFVRGRAAVNCAATNVAVDDKGALVVGLEQQSGPVSEDEGLRGLRTRLEEPLEQILARWSVDRGIVQQLRLLRPVEYMSVSFVCEGTNSTAVPPEGGDDAA